MTSLALAALVAVAVAPRVAVMPVRGDDDGAAQRILRAALADANVKLIDVDAVDRLIASAAKSGIACDAHDGECAARICAFGGLDFALVADVSEHARAAVVLHDCSDGREVRHIVSRLDDAARADGLAMLARAAVGEGEARGRIEVAAPAGGVVVIDGVERGPSPPPVDVVVGMHDVAWRAADGTQHTQNVDVAAAARARVSFEDAGATSTPAATTTAAPAGTRATGTATIAGPSPRRKG